MSAEYERVVRDCRIGIKAFQNFNASMLGFGKLLDLKGEGDYVILPSVFYWAVIRYAKPFLDSEYEGSRFSYPKRALKNQTGFVASMHEHLLLVRNKLIAHDDFYEVLPKILTMCMNLEEEGFLIPCSVSISNKIISFPSDSETVELMHNHVRACVEGAHEKLKIDLARLRNMMLENQDLAKESALYFNDYGNVSASEDGSFVKPNALVDPWLEVSVPDYSELHGGYSYEEIKMNQDFNGPELIIMPSGKQFTHHIIAKDPT